jgi:tetratricopeptide (TPR) repeat protein
MVASAQSIIDRPIRVYCPTHKVGFDAAANRTILCSSQKHAIAETFPNESFWEYCCDCQHCWIVDLAKTSVASEECLACERPIIRRFVCASCNVISIESDTPARRKAFTMATQGTPTPTCPGCLKKPTANPLDHECKDFGATFLTNFTTCPFCDEVLEAPPAFPCPVSEFLQNRRTPPTILRFDPKTNILSEAGSGEYVLIEKVRGTSRSIVIPKTGRLASRRDYYDTYYELFNCDNPSSGDVIVVSPAVVEKCDAGWQVHETGFIQIKSDEPTPATAPAATCYNCGTAARPFEQFCGKCGSPLLAGDTTLPLNYGATPSPAQPEYNPPFTAGPYANNFQPTVQDHADFGFANAPPINAPQEFASLDSVYGHAAPTSGVAPTKSVAPKVILIAVAAIFVLAIVISLAVSSTSTNTAEKQLDNAITSRNLESARGLYNQLKQSGASDEKLKPYRDRLLPLLTTGPYQQLSNLIEIGSDEPTPDQWLDAARNLNWAVEINPTDNKLAARAAYCEGRAQFLPNTKSEDALQSWQRSSNLDKSWSLPVNGIGLIYQNRSDHATSKSYFLRAMNLDPNWPHPYENLGNDYLNDKDYGTAKDYYQKALAKAPNWARPHWRLGATAEQQHDFETAVKEYEAALDPNAKGLKPKDVESVQKALDRARRSQPAAPVSNF